ncbi:MAG: DUF58 domain-containing protein, partial [Gemmataceae bacterium]
MRWFLGALVLLFAALVLESGLLAYAMYVLLGLMLVTRFLARSWVGNLSALRSVRPAGRRDEDDSMEDGPEGLALEIGDRIVVRLAVSNSGAIPVPWVLLEDVLPGKALDPIHPKLGVKGRRIQIGMLGSHGEMTMKYALDCLQRGYHQIGPLVLETGDLFGLHRRFRVLAPPRFVLVYPKIVPLSDYDLASRRPIGDVRIMHRLYED